MIVTRSPIRWAGSKYSIIKQLLPLIPDSYDRYIEPMFGSGAMFFALKPEKSIINDSNNDLINFLRVLKDHRYELIESLGGLKSSKDEYYKRRADVPKSDLERAVRFLYLNRLCWNGLYRVNRNGEFNVPFGSRNPNILWKEDQLIKCSEILFTVSLFSSDFSNIIKSVKKNDFVFMDPPYPKGTKEGIGFNRYSSSPFSIDDHLRLSKMLDKINDIGAKIMVTLGFNKEINSVYSRYFNKIEIETKSLISCNGDSRGKTIEIVLRNY